MQKYSFTEYSRKKDKDITTIVNAKKPLAAAKKIWKSRKYLVRFTIKNVETNETYQFNSKSWARNGKFL